MCGKLWVAVLLSALAQTTADDASGLPHTPGWYHRHGLKSPAEKKAELAAKKNSAIAPSQHKTKTEKSHDMDALDAAEAGIDHLVAMGKPKTIKFNPIRHMPQPKTDKEVAAAHAAKKRVSKVVKNNGLDKLGSKEINATRTPLSAHLGDFSGEHDAVETMLDSAEAQAHTELAKNKLKETEKVAPAKVTRVVKSANDPNVDVAAEQGLAGAEGIVKDIQQYQQLKKEKAQDDLLTKQEAITIKARELAAQAKKKQEEEAAQKAKDAAPKKVANLDALKALSETAHEAAVDSAPGHKEKKKHKIVNTAPKTE